MTFKYLACNIFSSLIAFLFIALTRYIKAQKIWFSPKIWPSTIYLFGFNVMFNNSSPTFRFWIFSVLSLERFIVLYFIIKSMIHFEVMFYTIGDLGQASIFVYGCPVVSASFVEEAIFPSLNCFCLFVKKYFYESLSEFSILFHFCMCLSLHQYQTVLR